MRLPETAILRRVLHALQAWDGFTSSEVERGFAAVRRVMGKHRDQVDDVSQTSIAKLVLDVPKAREEEVVSVARHIWLEYWGAERMSGIGNRSNFSKPRANSKHKGQVTETEFVRHRRKQVATATATCQQQVELSRSDVLAAATIASASTWGASHQAAEQKYQNLQNTSKGKAAIGDNVLLSREETADVRQVAAAEAKKRRQHDRDHDAKRRRVEQQIAPRAHVDLSRMLVWFSVNLGVESLKRCRSKLADSSLEKTMGLATRLCCSSSLMWLHLVTTQPWWLA